MSPLSLSRLLTLTAFARLNLPSFNVLTMRLNELKLGVLAQRLRNRATKFPMHPQPAASACNARVFVNHTPRCIRHRISKSVRHCRYLLGNQLLNVRPSRRKHRKLHK